MGRCHAAAATALSTRSPPLVDLGLLLESAYLFLAVQQRHSKGFRDLFDSDRSSIKNSVKQRHSKAFN